MLDISKLLLQLENAKESLFLENKDDRGWLYNHWIELCKDTELLIKVLSKKYSLLVPFWKGEFSYIQKIQAFDQNYDFLAVDGSQVYYDRHQGPGCYLINIGSCFLSYKKPISQVQLTSNPFVFVVMQDQEKDNGFVDLSREHQELKAALSISQQVYTENTPFLCCFDGSLIFWALDPQKEQDQQFLTAYLAILEAFYQKGIPYAGYVSYPSSRDLINVLKLYAVGFQDAQLDSIPASLGGLVDTDLAEWYLPEGHRSQLFESKAALCYLYPAHLKPYFCYMNVGKEIVRIELPAWIAKDSDKVMLICSILYDQALKGRGYPVGLFEAHEQAVIKQQDRQYFYHALQMIGAQISGKYSFSQKSLKKRNVDL